MASNSDDFFGGLFDFNGDGKTDLAEQFVAFKILEDIEKEESDEEDDDSYVPRTTLGDRLRIARENNPPQDEKPIPDCLTHAEYKQWKHTLISGCVLSVFLYAVFCVLPGLFVYAALSVFDARESASVLVSTVIALIGIVLIVCIFIAAVKTINECRERLQQARKAYLRSSKKEY